MAKKKSATKEMVEALHNDKASNDKERSKKKPAKGNILKGEQLDLLPKVDAKRGEKDCVCGKPGVVYSGLHSKHFCSDKCVELAMQNGKGMEGARIKVAANGTAAYYEQGDLMFPVDPKDLNRVVDGNREGTPVDKLMDSQVLTFAQANGLPVVPFVRELLRPVLIGILQLVWYRDVERRELSDHLKDNQLNRYKWYLNALATWKEKPAEGAAKPAKAATKKAGGAAFGKTAEERAAAKGAALTQQVKLKKMPKAEDLPKQAFILCEVLKEKGGALSVADLLNACEGRIVTKQGIPKILAFYRNKLTSNGFLEFA